MWLRDSGHQKNCLLVTNGLAKKCSCGLWDIVDLLTDDRDTMRAMRRK